MATSQQSIYTNPPQDESFNFNTTKVSPSILLIIVILAVIFFVSGLLHLLVRFLLHPNSGDPHRGRRSRDGASDTDSVTALQGQLQQLFHLHDAGVDQSFIDTLPVFHYKAIIGSKSPFDCAVCLCEFEPDDKLRLLPKCSHAFHTDCIDTWLLSHSTCPLCRASLLFPPDCSPPPPLSNNVVVCSPAVLVLESAGSIGGSSREIEGAADSAAQHSDKDKERVVAVKLGKFRNVDSCGGEGSSGGDSSSVKDIGADSRRCFSMGSFAYVMDESSNLRVPIRTPLKKEKNPNAVRIKNPGLFGRRGAISECDCESKREFEFDEVVSKPAQTFSETNAGDGGCSVDSPRRAFSFRFIGRGSGVCADDLKGKNGKFPRRTVSEIGVARWVSGEGNNNNNNNSNGELGLGEESDRSINSLDSQSNQTSFARKTLLWLMGRQQNKVVHSSFDPPNNV